MRQLITGLLLGLSLSASPARAQAAPPLDGFRLNEAYRAPKKAPPCVTGVYLRAIFRPGTSSESSAIPAAECEVREGLVLTLFNDTIRMMQMSLGAPPEDSVITLWRLNRTRLTELMGRAPDQASRPMQGQIDMLSMIWNPADSTGWVGIGMFSISRISEQANSSSSLLLASCRLPRAAQPGQCRAPGPVPPVMPN